VYEVDRQTGRTWVIIGDKKIEAKEPTLPPALQTIPRSLTAKINGRVGPGSSRGYFSGDVYNGTQWTVRELRLELTVHTKDGESWVRSFHIDTTINSYKTSTIVFDVADRREVERFTWALVEARGYPPD